MAIERLAAGQAFHRTVQSAFLTGLAGASGFSERKWRLVRGGRGRVDLAVEVDERMLIIIENRAFNATTAQLDAVQQHPCPRP